MEKYNGILSILMYFHQLVDKKNSQSNYSTSDSDDEFLSDTDESILHVIHDTSATTAAW